jgi:hypothetical protein
MGALSDEAAAGAAERAGDRFRGSAAPERIYAREVATGRWCHPPEIVFTEEMPTCDTCGAIVLWKGAKRIRGGWAYRLECCNCGPDLIVSPFRLCQGGTLRWWRVRLGWVDEVPPEPLELVLPEAAEDEGDTAAVG